MNDKINLEVTYPHPPERVWKSLTDPAALGKWLLAGDFKPLIGYRFRFESADGTAIRGKVTDVEPGNLLAYTWEDGDEGEGSLVVWQLDPVDGGTRLRLEHRRLESPAVTSLGIDAYFNWSYALRHSLPGLLQLLRGAERLRPPMVYVEEEVAAHA